MSKRCLSQSNNKHLDKEIKTNKKLQQFKSENESLKPLIISVVDTQKI